MTETRWKKSRVNKSNEIKHNNIDHGTVSYDEPMPIPTFNVLVNTPSPSSSSSEETSSLNVNPSLSTQQQSILSKAIQKIKSVLNPFMKLQPEDDKIIEGLSKFQLFSDDNYYKSCKKILKKLKLDWVLTGISEAIKYALCPLSKTDELIDKGVERFVRLFVQLRNCMKDDAKVEDGELDLSPVAEARLLWNEGDAPLQYTGEDDDDVEEEGIIIEGYEDEKGEGEENKDKKDKKEPSSLESNIYTLSDQHTWINTHELIAKLGSHYIYKLNQTENQLGRYLTESELYEFHNTYNNMLEKQDVINSIKGMPISQQWEWLSNKRYSSMSSERRNRRRNPNEPERVLSLCEEKQRAAIQELKQNAKHVKRQIYNIVMIPVVIYIVYNMYYVFLFMETKGEKDSEENNKVNSFFGSMNSFLSKKSDVEKEYSSLLNKKGLSRKEINESMKEIEGEGKENAIKLIDYINSFVEQGFSKEQVDDELGDMGQEEKQNIFKYLEKLDKNKKTELSTTEKNEIIKEQIDKLKRVFVDEERTLIEEEYDESSSKELEYIKFLDYDETVSGASRFLTEYLFRPIHILIAFLEWIKGSELKISYYSYGRKQYEDWVIYKAFDTSYLRSINDSYPQIIFFTLFVVIFVGWRYNPNFIPNVIKNLYKGKHPMVLNYIILGITGASYLYSLLVTTQHKDTEQEENQFSSIAEALKKPPDVFSIIGNIIFWIFKGLFAYNMVSLTVSIFIAYCLSYLLFGIYMYASKPFDRISRINQFLYSKMFKLSHSESEFENTLMDGLNSISRTIFTHMFEVITIIMLLIGMDGYIKKINNADLNTFLMLLSSLFIFVLCCMIGLKQMNFMSTLKPLMKLLKIPLNESQLEEGKTQIGEIQRKVECIRTLEEFMKIATDEIDPDKMDTDKCIKENIAAAIRPKA